MDDALAQLGKARLGLASQRLPDRQPELGVDGAEVVAQRGGGSRGGVCRALELDQDPGAQGQGRRRGQRLEPRQGLVAAARAQVGLGRLELPDLAFAGGEPSTLPGRLVQV